MNLEEIAIKRHSLIVEREELQYQLDQIRSQVTDAKRKAAQSGNYSDGDWLRRAESAARHRGREILQINGELAELRAEEKRLNIEINNKKKDDFKGLFIAVCKRRLSEELYLSIMQEAQEAAENDFYSQG